MPYLISDDPLRISPLARPAITFQNLMFSLIVLHMSARNNVATKYLAMGENFPLSAIHISAMKNIPFAERTLPYLPATMPSLPPGYVHFLLNINESQSKFLKIKNITSEYNIFTKKCRTEGCPSSAAHIGSRSPFQLAVMISPPYLLVTLRSLTIISSQNCHRFGCQAINHLAPWPLKV